MPTANNGGQKQMVGYLCVESKKVLESFVKTKNVLKSCNITAKRLGRTISKHPNAFSVQIKAMNSDVPVITTD